MKQRKLPTLPVHGEIEISYLAVMTKDLTKVILVDVLCQFLDDDL